MSMPVIVGKAVQHETPIFIGEMRAVEFSPYWNVPRNILRNETLPRLARDPGYLGREDMELVSTRGDGRVLQLNSYENRVFLVHLEDGGAVVAKFWLAISKDEQHRRFKEREKTRHKQFKITDEDWRNRDKTELYDAAIEEMFKRTDHELAPWHMVSGEQKK